MSETWSQEYESEITRATKKLLDEHLDLSGLFVKTPGRTQLKTATDVFKQKVQSGVVPATILELSQHFLGHSHGVLPPPDSRSRVIEAIHAYSQRLFLNVQKAGIPFPLFAHVASLPSGQIKASEPPAVTYIRVLLPILKFAFISFCFFFDTVLQHRSTSIIQEKREREREREKGNEGDQASFFAPHDLLHIADTFSFLEFVAVDLPIVRRLYSRIFQLIAEDQLALDQFWAMVPKPIAHYTVIQNVPLSDPVLRSSCCESVDPFFTRCSFFLFGTRFLLPRLPDCLIENEIVPLMFFFLNLKNAAINSMSHSLFAALISLCEEKPLSLRVIPRYIQISLQNFPSITKASYLAGPLAAIFGIVPLKDRDLSLFCLDQVLQKVLTKENGSPDLLEVVLSLIPKTNPSILDQMLVSVGECLEELPLNARVSAMSLLRHVISNNHDYNCKSTFVNWFLHLLQQLGLNHGYLEPVPLNSDPSAKL